MTAKPTIHGARIILRPPRSDDVDAYFALLQDVESLRLTGTQGTFSNPLFLQNCKAPKNLV